jgi:hypothetical protein
MTFPSSPGRFLANVEYFAVIISSSLPTCHTARLSSNSHLIHRGERRTRAAATAAAARTAAPGTFPFQLTWQLQACAAPIRTGSGRDSQNEVSAKQKTGPPSRIESNGRLASGKESFIRAPSHRRFDRAVPAAESCWSNQATPLACRSPREGKFSVRQRLRAVPAIQVGDFLHGLARRYHSFPKTTLSTRSSGSALAHADESQSAPPEKETSTHRGPRAVDWGCTGR